MRARPSCSPSWVLCLIVLFLSPRASDLRAGELQDLVKQYQGAKKERLASEEKKARGKGRNRNSRKERRKRGARSLEEILLEIAALESDAALRFLAREYGDRDPTIAALCAGALLETGHPKAPGIVIKGYNRGGKWSTYAKVKVLDGLATAPGEEGLAFVLKLARRGDFDTQTLALGSLALRPQEKKVVPEVLRALEHRSYQVRNAALRAAKRFRFKEMIAPLIERLTEEKDEKLRTDALELLVDLTGVNMGFEVRDWRKWWETAAARFEFSQKESGSTRVVTPDLQYFGIEVASKRIAFLVDASNSMLRGPDGRGGKKGKRGAGKQGGAKKGGGRRNPAGGGRKIDILKEELTRILKELPADTFINIIYFHRSSVPWKKQLHALKGRGRQEAISFVRGLTCAYGTNIYDTLELALKDKRVDTIYLLSDGRPVGGKYSEPDDILRHIGAINRVRGARINCISFGKETVFLKQLAAQNGGEYRATGGK